MLLEELHNIQQAVNLSDAQFESIIMISSNHSAPEKSLQCIKNLDVFFVLDYPKLRQDLKSHFHFGMFIDANIETAFPINETNNPIRGELHRSSYIVC